MRQDMKLTGKLLDEGLVSFTKKPPLKSGRKTPRIWILVADNHLARVYKKNYNRMELIGEAEPEESLIESEINNKTMGRIASAAGSTVHHKFEPHTNASRQEELTFAREISDFLEQVETADVFDRLIIIAPPKMLGDLRSNFSKLVKNRIVAEVDKDLTKLNDKDFEEALKKIIGF